MKVVVTGAASRFARALLPRLCDDTSIAEVRAVSAGAIRFGHEKLRAFSVELGRPVPTDVLSGCDALVHLYSAAPSAAGADALFELQVRGAHKLFHSARTRGLKRLVHVSTAAVYGSAVHANEDTPLKPLTGFTYAEHQAHLEKLLSIDFPHCVRLRPHVIVGPHAHPFVKAMLKQPFYARLAEDDPLFQCVHEDDVVQAILACLKSDARGPYNLAIDRSFTLQDALRLRHHVAVPLPASIARRGIELAARLTGAGPERDWMPALTRTLIINCRRAIIDLGWKPAYSAREALRSL